MGIQVIVTMLAACLVPLSGESESVYIRPSNNPTTMECTGHPCQSLTEYIQQHKPKSDSTDVVTMILLVGDHRVGKFINTINFGSPAGAQTVHIKGEGEPENVTVHGLETGITDIATIIIENITVYTSSILGSISHSTLTNVSIFNRKFIKSSIVLTSTYLNVKDSEFLKSTSTAISLYSSFVTFMGQVTFTKNEGLRGGALALTGTTMRLAKNVDIHFNQNHAKEVGGAIFVSNSGLVLDTHGYVSECFYQLLDYDSESKYILRFINNSAKRGGDHIYGASLKSACSVDVNNDADNDTYSYQIIKQQKYIVFEPGYPSTLSAVSSDATAACICVDGQPQCYDYTASFQVYPGVLFSIPIVLVGGDYGATVGTAYAAFIADGYQSAFLGSSDQTYQVITTNLECTLLSFSVYSNKSREMMFITTNVKTLRSVDEYLSEYYQLNDTNSESHDDFDYYIDTMSRNFPLFINLTLLPCPPGFVLLGYPPGCDCHPALKANTIDCELKNEVGYHIWNANIWVEAVDDGQQSRVSFSTHCPFDYCKHGRKYIDLKNNQDGQCAFNHAGRLCGRCKENYSLAIGSSHCIHCPNNNNLALLIFFAAAGILLVFIIAALNLTVTQGTINGLVFYANILWAYQNLLFPPGFDTEFIVHKTFIAWLNLDFGIETSFISGMNAYMKTWLQFIFPFYTAGIFYIGIRYSTKLSKLFGSRSVPTLATLLFLSYSKLLRTIIACLQLVTYFSYSDSNKDASKTIVWALDGSLLYGHYPHIFLLLAAIVCFILLWVPYTLLLLSMQWLRRVDHHGPLKLIAKYKPVYDAYFAPLNDKHHYWFGMLLLVQGILLLVLSLTASTIPALSVLLLLTVSTLLLCYINAVRTYKRMSVILLESSFLVNFIALIVGNLYYKDDEKQRKVLLSVSITAAFVKFCGIVIWNLTPNRVKKIQLKCVCICSKVMKAFCSKSTSLISFCYSVIRKRFPPSNDHVESDKLQIIVIDESPDDNYEAGQYINYHDSESYSAENSSSM